MLQRLQYRRRERPCECPACGGTIHRGARLVYDEETRRAFCSQVCAARDYRARPPIRPKKGA